MASADDAETASAKKAVAAGLALALSMSYAKEQHSPSDPVMLDGLSAWRESRADEEGDPLTDLGAFWQWRAAPGMAKDGPSASPQRVRRIGDQVATRNPLPRPCCRRAASAARWARSPRSRTASPRPG